MTWIVSLLCLLLAGLFWFAERWRDVGADVDEFLDGPRSHWQ
jgi:hypothetical protein